MSTDRCTQHIWQY